MMGQRQDKGNAGSDSNQGTVDSVRLKIEVEKDCVRLTGRVHLTVCHVFHVFSMLLAAASA